uniref:Transmembrane O-mannosyltransferase targeting cadherins 1 n=1 Tax=Sarcophilus harrisii TaxID=9305 RepID=A0A7N4Q0E0_SARHA
MAVTAPAAGGGGCGSRRDRTASGQRQGGFCLAPAEAAVLLTAVCCLCYGNSLRGEFVHDDVWAIVNNPDVRAAAPLGWGMFANDFWGKRMAENTSHKSYRPLCILTFKINVYLAGMNPFYFHAVNIILHCLVTLVLMYTCDKVVFKDHQLGFVTALIFAVHPIHTEANLEQNEVLVGLLFLIFPFLPASNLFFSVGFVVAERILYMPSMGYCILFVHGLNKLYSWLNRCGTTTLMMSTLLLLLLFSCKTVKQNEIWLSRESLFRSGVETLPHNAKVHYNYANFLKDQGRNEEAIYHYKTALKLYPHHASALNNLGTLTKDRTEAKEYYKKALQLNPQHNRALFNLGNLLKSQGKKDEAIIFLRDSIKFGPEFADAYSSLASLLAEQELFQKAEEVYQAGIKNCPESSDLHNNYGVFLVDTGTPESAIYHYQQAIQLSPHHHVAMVNLGRLYRSLGENKEAEEWYKRALDITQTAEILSPLGALYYNTGRYEEALQIYREAAALQPSAKEIQLALALEAIDKALQLKPKDPKVISELFFTKGNQLREQNFLDKAFESYQVAVQLNPEQAQAWMNMGGIEHIKGDYVSARGYYEKALQLVPNSKLLKENLAKLDRLEKRLQEVSRKRSDTVAL